MTAEQLHIIRHAIGYDDAGNDRWHGAKPSERRNRYVTDPTGPDGIDCQSLCAQGFMVDRGAQQICGGAHCYQVTAKGWDIVRDNAPRRPKLTRSQLRYRMFLETDPGMRFGEWLKLLKLRA